MKKWIGLTLGGLAGLLAFRLLEVPIAAGVSKMVASCGFIALAISGGAGSTRYGKIILAGLFFSWWGDAFLIGTNSLYFQLGLVSFLLGHVCYSTAFFVHGVRVRWSLLTLLLLTPFAVGILVWLLPYVPGDLRGPVLAYIVVITSMVVLAVGVRGRGGPLGIAVGAVLFYISDIAVATNQFVAPDTPHYLWGLPTYYAGQLFLAWSVKSLVESSD